MLGRTRPASRFLLWPRSSWAARFTTTLTEPSHEATAEPDSSRDDVVSPPKKEFAGIRKLNSELKDRNVLWAAKYSIRRLKRNTAPIPQASWAKFQKASGEPEAGGNLTKKRWTPARRTVAQDTPDWVERYSAKRHLVKGSRHHERGSRTAGDENNRLPGASIGVDPESSKVAPHGQWKPFTFNSELAGKGPSSPANIPSLSSKPFTLNPDLAARGRSSPAHTPMSPSSFTPPNKNLEHVQSKYGTPLPSEVLGEMQTWNFEMPPMMAESSNEEPELVPEDDGPPRSKIIGEMKTWNFEAPAVSEVDSDIQEVVSKSPPRSRKENLEELPPLDCEFREWLITATETAVAEAEKNRAKTNNVAVYDGPTVLVLNAASRSLLESDFYRLAPQGKHLGDWAVGIARIIQARHPATYEPLGKYYIFFHTRAAAIAYSEEVWRLHELSQRAAHLISTSLSSSDSIPGPLPLAPTLAVDKGTESDLDAALRGYTLLPHSARLDLKLHLCKDLPVPAEDRLSSMSQVAHHHFVLINLEGCKTTLAALHEAISRDGEERRLPWGLAVREDGRPSIAAVVPDDGSEAELSWRGSVADDDDPGNRFWRFIVPFTEAVEARRFVRNWHRREMRDLEGRNMVVVFNVTALW